MRAGYADQRYYNFWYGRFNTPDPLGSKAADPSNPISWNMYAYVGGDPVNRSDPTGTIDDFPSLMAPPDWGGGGGGGGFCGPDWFMDASLSGPCGNPCGSSFLPNPACGYQGPAPPPDPAPTSPPPPDCGATLYSRPLDFPVLKQLGFTHAYWEVDEEQGGQVIFDFMVSSGPPPKNQVPTDPATGKKFSDLNVYVHSPSDLPDTAANSTWSWNTGSSASNCAGVIAMLTYANYWELHYNNNPTQGVPYSGFSGPNSNSFAAYLGQQIGGFSPPRPPGAHGWGYWP